MLSSSSSSPLLSSVSFSLQIDEYINEDGTCDDMAIYDNLPINWWLDNECICYLLAMLVCRDLPDITNDPDSLPAGQTRKDQRKRAADEDEKEKAIEKHNKLVEESPSTDRKLKEATIMGMKGAAIKQRVVTMATSVGMIKEQVAMLEQCKSVLVAQWGQEEYDSKIANLMTKMLDDRQMSGEALLEQATQHGENEAVDDE